MLPKSLRPLFPYLKKYRGSYFVGTICVFINNGVWILFPLVLRHAVDGLQRRRDSRKTADLLPAADGGGGDQGHLPVSDPLDRDRHFARD